MAQEWRVKKILARMNIQDSTVSGKVQDLKPTQYEALVALLGLTMMKAKDAKDTLKRLTTPSGPPWDLKQRAEFVQAWSHKDLKDTETLKEWLPKHAGIKRMSHYELVSIAKHLIIGEDSKNPTLKSLCNEGSGNSDDTFYVLKNKPSAHKPLTDAVLKKYKFTPPTGK